MPSLQKSNGELNTSEFIESINYLLKNSHSSCKKGAAQSGSLTQDGQGEKVVKSSWQPRNDCDGRSMGKIFNNNNSGEFVSSSQLH